MTNPPGEMPITVTVRGSKVNLVFSVIAGGVFIVAALAFAGGALSDIPNMPAWAATVMPLGLAAIGIWRIARAFLAMRGQREYRIGGGEVRCGAASDGGSADWTEPLSAYRGVRWRSYMLARQSDRDRGRVNVIELAHPDPDRTVPLVVRRTGNENAAEAAKLAWDMAQAGADAPEETRKALEDRAARLARESGDGAVRAKWEELARQLDMPAIDARDGAEVVRAAEDVDKSIVDLAEEGKVSRDWHGAPAPESLEVRTLGDPDDPESQELHVILHATTMPLWFFLVFGAIGAVTFVAGLVQLQFGLMFFGLVFGGVGGGMWYLERRFPRSIRISRTRMSYQPASKTTGHFTLPLDRIESIHIASADRKRAGTRTLNLSGRELVISSDDGEQRIGSGLDDAALEWLRDYLVSAVANA
jgi:hypothetical protein